MQSGRTGFAPCGAGLACLLHAPPCHLACARRGLRSLPSRLCPPPPAFIAAVLHASRFAARIAPRLPEGVELYALRLHETATSYAEWVAEDNN